MTSDLCASFQLYVIKGIIWQHVWWLFRMQASSLSPKNINLVILSQGLFEFDIMKEKDQALD